MQTCLAFARLANAPRVRAADALALGAVDNESYWALFQIRDVLLAHKVHVALDLDRCLRDLGVIGARGAIAAVVAILIELVSESRYKSSDMKERRHAANLLSS